MFAAALLLGVGFSIALLCGLHVGQTAVAVMKGDGSA